MEWTDLTAEFGNIAGKKRKPDPVQPGKRRELRPETTGRGRADVSHSDVAYKPSSYTPCAEYKDGKLVSLKVTSTLIKRLFWKGEPREHVCPKKVYHDLLKADVKTPPSEIMIRGLLFEAICGKNKQAEKYYNEKLRLASGKHSVHTERIYEQAGMFEIVANKYGIEIDQQQVKLHGALELEKFPDLKLSLEGTADLATPVHAPGFDYAKAIVDIKLTMDRNSEFGEFSWGSPEYMDHTQIVLYSYLSGVPGAYLVFDYKARDRGHKLLPIATMAMFKTGEPTNPELSEFYNVAKDRFTNLKVLIKDTIYMVLKWDTEGYRPMPSYDACKDCPLNPVNQIIEGDLPRCNVASFTNMV